MHDLTQFRNRRVRLVTDHGVAVTGVLVSWTATGRRTIHVVDDRDVDRFIPRASLLAVEPVPV